MSPMTEAGARSYGSTPRLLLVLLAALGAHPTMVSANVSLLGRWSIVDHDKWSPGNATGATHMVLLRGRADSSRVLYFYDHKDTRLWLWNPALDTTSASISVPDPQERDFCAGLVTLPDGRAFVAGGTTQGETGSRNVGVFDAKSYGASGNGWTAQDPLVYGRWYPQATLLSSGQVLVMSGHHHFEMIEFGGVDSSGTRLDDARPMKLLNNAPAWKTDPTTARPAAREGHVAVYDADGESPSKTMFVWGGRDGSGTDSLTTIWRLIRSDADSGERWQWKAMGTGVPDPSCNCLPAPRADAGAVLLGDSLIIFGGRTVISGVSTALSDVWRLKFVRPTPTSTDTLRWERIVPQSGGPGPRYDHALTIDPGVCWSHLDDGPNVCSTPYPLPQLIVHGGRRSATTMAGDTVWALPLNRRCPDTEPNCNPSGTPAWSAIALGGPGARAGHTAVLDPYRRSGYGVAEGCRDTTRREIVFYGGWDGTQTKGDLWHLSRVDTIPTPGWMWRSITPGPATTGCRPTPPPRMDHTAIYDWEFDRMLVFGGDTTGSGARMNDAWSWSFGYSLKCWPSPYSKPVPSWVCMPADSAPSKRSGHTAVFERGLPVYARLPERYTVPKVTGQAQSEVLGFAQKRQPFYPSMHQLSSGKLFWTGNSDSAGKGPSYVLDLANQTKPWQDPRYSDMIGAASVMFRPDSVMKCGGNNVAINAAKTTKWVPAATTLPWKPQLPMQLDRSNHNLTILPTGQVLATGGEDKIGTPQRAAELWTRTPGDSAGSWGQLMSSDPYVRVYHSAALLLPDARVLVSGGSPSDKHATIFWPPYLFANAAGTLRSRPQITAACNLDAGVHYGEVFRVHYSPSTDTIGSACLIRPSATTHQSDMNQRFLPLSFDSVGAGVIKLTAPANANVAPAGDHLLFLVRKDGTPSVAKWVRLENDTIPPAATSWAEPGVSSTSIVLTWGAPGDDDLVGRATAYDLRYYTSPITEENFGSAWQIGTGTPKCSGQGENLLVSGLTACHDYYFGIKTRDEVGNWSPLVTLETQTTCGGFGPMAGGGEGGSGEESAGGVAGMELFASTSEASVAGSLLNPALPGDQATDRLVLPGMPQGDEVSIRLVQLAGASVTVDAIRLLAVDHDDSEEVFATESGILTGTRRPSTGRWKPDGTALTLADPGTEWTGLPFASGETLLVSLGAPREGAERGGVAIEALGSQPSSGPTGIVVEGTGSDTTRVRILPRADFNETAVETTSDTVRLVFSSTHWLRSVSAVDRGSIAAVDSASLTGSMHSRVAEVAEWVASDDTASTVLEPGDTLRLSFSVEPPVAGKARTLVLEAAGKTQRVTGEAGPLSSRVATAVPLRFSLEQNRPNPFARSTTIRFDLPIAAATRLEIFDIAGRRVRTLMDTRLPAGSHAVSWDRSHNSSGRASPGVYIYRLRAGAFEDRKRMVVLP